MFENLVLLNVTATNPDQFYHLQADSGNGLLTGESVPIKFDFQPIARNALYTASLKKVAECILVDQFPSSIYFFSLFFWTQN